MSSEIQKDQAVNPVLSSIDPQELSRVSQYFPYADTREGNVDIRSIVSILMMTQLNRHKNEFNEESYQISRRYERLLDTGHPLLQPFLRSGNFTSSLLQSRRSDLGPFTDGMFAAAEQGNLWVFLFSAGHAPQIAALDRSNYTLQEQPKDTSGSELEEYREHIQRPALDVFNYLTSDVLTTVSDEAHPSKWRDFLLSNFPTLSQRVLRVSDPRAFLLFAERDYNRMKKLVEEFQGDDTDLLAKYLEYSTERYDGAQVQKEFDEEVVMSDFQRVKRYLSHRVKSKVYDYEHTRRDDRLPTDFYWFDKFKNGVIDFATFEQTHDSLAGFIKAADNLIDNDATYNELERLCIDPEFPLVSEIMIHLLENGIVPTENLIAFIEENGAAGIDALRSLRDDTKEGRFDPRNLMQRDLEFTKLLSLSKITWAPPRTRNTFLNIGYVGEAASSGVELSFQEHTEARATAYEAAQVYWLVKEATDRGRKVVVIGNKRYGENFVVNPLRWHLDKLPGVSTDSMRVSSGETSAGKIYSGLFSQYNLDHVLRTGRDMFVIDGSNSPLSENDEHPRFPRSMHGYLNWFLAYNDACEFTDERNRFSGQLLQLAAEGGEYDKLVEDLRRKGVTTPYSIRFYSPMAETASEERVAIGYDNKHISYLPFDASDPMPQVVLVNPVVVPGRVDGYPKEFVSHIPGRFDDHEALISKNASYVFTKYGLETARDERTESQYLEQVQKCLGNNIEEMIRLANPALK